MRKNILKFAGLTFAVMLIAALFVNCNNFTNQDNCKNKVKIEIGFGGQDQNRSTYYPVKYTVDDIDNGSIQMSSTYYGDSTEIIKDGSISSLQNLYCEVMPGYTICAECTVNGIDFYGETAYVGQQTINIVLHTEDYTGSISIDLSGCKEDNMNAEIFLFQALPLDLDYEYLCDFNISKMAYVNFKIDEDTEEISSESSCRIYSTEGYTEKPLAGTDCVIDLPYGTYYAVSFLSRSNAFTGIRDPYVVSEVIENVSAPVVDVIHIADGSTTSYAPVKKEAKYAEITFVNDLMDFTFEYDEDKEIIKCVKAYRDIDCKEISSSYVKLNEPLAAGIIPEIEAVDGATFKGWKYSDRSVSGWIYVDDLSEFIPTEECTLYTNWEIADMESLLDIGLEKGGEYFVSYYNAMMEGDELLEDLDSYVFDKDNSEENENGTVDDYILAFVIDEESDDDNIVEEIYLNGDLIAKGFSPKYPYAEELIDEFEYYYPWVKAVLDLEDLQPLYSYIGDNQSLMSKMYSLMSIYPGEALKPYYNKMMFYLAEEDRYDNEQTGEREIYVCSYYVWAGASEEKRTIELPEYGETNTGLQFKYWYTNSNDPEGSKLTGDTFEIKNHLIYCYPYFVDTSLSISFEGTVDQTSYGAFTVECLGKELVEEEDKFGEIEFVPYLVYKISATHEADSYDWIITLGGRIEYTAADENDTSNKEVIVKVPLVTIPLNVTSIIKKDNFPYSENISVLIMPYEVMGVKTW